jgi:transcription elongation factor
VRDVVKVIDGPHSGRNGEVKHLFRNFAFLFSRMMMDNGGIFVCKCRHLVTILWIFSSAKKLAKKLKTEKLLSFIWTNLFDRWH